MVKRWRSRLIIEKEIQVGFSHFIEETSGRYLESVGLQKWNDKYKVYIGNIKENKMVSEEFEKDEIKEFDNLGEALEYMRIKG